MNKTFKIHIFFRSLVIAWLLLRLSKEPLDVWNIVFFLWCLIVLYDLVQLGVDSDRDE